MAFKGSRQASRCHYQHDCTATLPPYILHLQTTAQAGVLECRLPVGGAALADLRLRGSVKFNSTLICPQA